MTRTKEVTALKMGIGSDNEPITRDLRAFMEILQGVADAIPAECLATAVVDFGPDHEYGETYESFAVVYDAPMTPDEIRAADAALAEFWRIRLAGAQADAANCAAELARLTAPAKAWPWGKAKAAPVALPDTAPARCPRTLDMFGGL